jgi:hypothetical protein
MYAKKRNENLAGLSLEILRPFGKRETSTVFNSPAVHDPISRPFQEYNF